MANRFNTIADDIDQGLDIIASVGLMVLLSPIMLLAWVVGRVSRFVEVRRG